MKFMSKKTDYNGKTYDSKAEAMFAMHLNVIGIPFEQQPKVMLQEGFTDTFGTCRPIFYISDFKVGKYLIDVKGIATPDFRIKAKMVRYNQHKNGVVLLIAKYSRCGWTLWEWEEPRKNTKRKPFDIVSLIPHIGNF